MSFLHPTNKAGTAISKDFKKLIRTTHPDFFAHTCPLPVAMGLRSSVRSGIRRIGKRVLSALKRCPTARRHDHTCSVCIAEKAINAVNEKAVCASHRGLSPVSPPVLPMPDLETPTDDVTGSQSTAFSRNVLRALPDMAEHYASILGIEEDSRDHDDKGCATAQSLAQPLSLNDIWDEMLDTLLGADVLQQPAWQLRREHRWPVMCLLAGLDRALAHVRWAASGNLALWLYGCFEEGGAGYDLWAHASEEKRRLLLSSQAAQPSIVCPLSSCDVLVSWAATMRPQLVFDAWARDVLYVSIDGSPVAVRIMWVPDEQFARHPYALVPGGRYHYSTPPVLSLDSVAAHAAHAYAYSPFEDEANRRVLAMHVEHCRRLLQAQVRRQACYRADETQEHVELEEPQEPLLDPARQ